MRDKHMRGTYFKYTNYNVDEELEISTIMRVGDIINSETPIKWKCKECNNEWFARPTKVIKGKTGCPKCAYTKNGNRRCLTNEQVDSRIQQLGFKIQRLSKVKRGVNEVKWKCQVCEHAWFSPPVWVLKTKHGCPKCANKKKNENRKYTNNNIDNLIDNRNFIRIGKYKGMHYPIEWECYKFQHRWLAKPSDIIHKNSSCPYCVPVSYSKMSIEWLEKISKVQKVFIQHAGNLGEFKIPGTRYRVDGYCKETNTVYEFYGDYYHGNLNLFAPEEKCHPYSEEAALELYNKTIAREKVIKSKGFNLITIWEKDYV